MSPDRRRGLLVDYGGVLTTDVFASFAAFCGREGLPKGRVKALFRSDPTARALLADLEVGTLTDAEFEERFAALLGVAQDGLITRMLGDAGPDTRMLAAVRTARRLGVRTGLISNSWGLAGYDRALLAELFDGVVISGEVGVRKPAPEIYLQGARAVGLKPQDCVYVDDLRGNLKPARELGMATVHHTGPEASIAELEDLLGVKLS
jgi:epoxide hydrolase-like predicted phosphatase